MSEQHESWSPADEEWLHALRQPGAGPTAGEPAREAQLLRQALADERETIERSQTFRTLIDSEREERGLRELLEEVERRHLLASPCRRPRFWRAIMLPAALAGAAVLAWLHLTPQLSAPPPPIYDEPPAWRGALATIEKPSSAPRRDAEILLQRLRATAVESPAIYQRGATFIVEFSVPAPLSEETSDVLRREGIPGAPGTVRVEFVPQ